MNRNKYVPVVFNNTQHRKKLRFVSKNFIATLFNYVVINGILKQLSFSSLKLNKTKL